jgi:hypothetical protein
MLFLLTLFKPCVCPASGGQRQMAWKTLTESTLQSFCKAEFRKNATSHATWKPRIQKVEITSRTQIQAALAAEEAQAQVKSS